MSGTTRVLFDTTAVIVPKRLAKTAKKARIIASAVPGITRLKKVRDTGKSFTFTQTGEPISHGKGSGATRIIKGGAIVKSAPRK